MITSFTLPVSAKAAVVVAAAEDSPRESEAGSTHAASDENADRPLAVNRRLLDIHVKAIKTLGDSLASEMQDLLVPVSKIYNESGDG